MSRAVSSTASQARPRLYPAYAFSASPTFNTWVKLTAADVHGLRSERGFEGQNVYFHLNHPVRYVRLVGPIVTTEFIHDRLTILTLDDGSGATIDVKIAHEPPRLSSGNQPADAEAADDDDADVVADTEDDSKHPRKERAAGRAAPTILTTSIPNLIVLKPAPPSPRIQSMISLNATPIEVGTIVKAKGTISSFRGSMQLTLLRVSIVMSTAEEARCWTELAQFYETVLGSPWVLSNEQVSRLQLASVQREKEDRDQLRIWEAKTAQRRRESERIRRRREEKRRRAEVEMNKGALQGL